MLIEFGEGDLFREIFVTTAAFDLEVPLSMLRKGDSSNILSSSHEDKLEEDHVDILPIIYYKRRTSEN